VLWERWNEVPSEHRASIIMDAYERVDPAIVPNLTIVTGVTMDEAIDLNLFPTRSDDAEEDRPDFDWELRQAMREEGAIRDINGSAIALPDAADGRKSHARLSQRVPGPIGRSRKLCLVLRNERRDERKAQVQNNRQPINNGPCAASCRASSSRCRRSRCLTKSFKHLLSKKPCGAANRLMHP